MIRPLRTRHRWIVTLMAILLPLLVALALTSRRTVPVMPDPPGVATGVSR